MPTGDLTARVANPKDENLLRMARLDCDWHGENARAFAQMSHADFEFLPARVVGSSSMLDLLKTERPPNEEWWLIFDGQNPQKLAGALGKLLPLLTRKGVRVLYYAFDEASRTMPCFRELAPHLSVLIHDESPLDDHGSAALPTSCTCIHRSWVANLVPFAAPFNEKPESKILFLGSKLGLTDHRKRQIDYLRNRFGDCFVAIHDHSVNVADRTSLNRFKVSVCPEGRKFTTPAMSATHTDRPFWSGCLGMVPVSENSQAGGRLEQLAQDGLILRYPHGDLDALTAACEQALALPDEQRRRIYNHFNRHETVGTVVAAAIATSARTR
ncbi:MAG: hypothetical protein IPP19_13860 [Verrucomicrobia bacterium]|nr:hypothetical protein [Verrucomicrobiota bacterium]